MDIYIYTHGIGTQEEFKKTRSLETVPVCMVLSMMEDKQGNENQCLRIAIPSGISYR